jgi:hypothetical protein
MQRLASRSRSRTTVCFRCGREIGYEVNHKADAAKAGALVHCACEAFTGGQARRDGVNF